MNVGRKKTKLSVGAGVGGVSVSHSQKKKNIEAERDPQPDGEIQVRVRESMSFGPIEREGSQDDPPSLTKRKSQEERFDEMRRATLTKPSFAYEFSEQDISFQARK